MMSSDKAVAWKRFSIGELARKRKALKESYLAANSETVRLQNELNVAQKDVNKITEGRDFAYETDEFRIIFYS